MALIYLLDTNALSEAARSAPNPIVLARLQANADHIAIAATTWHELWFGLLRLPSSKKREVVERFLLETAREMPVLPYEKSAAEWFAQERARLTQIGRPPSYPDGQIAAVAAVNNLILVTRNTADFAHFAGLRLENWFEAAA
jgi:tRNA(fMet)-specific endonuclease VapC